MVKIREMAPSEIDQVLKLHVEGLDRELELLQSIMPCKKTNPAGLPELRKILLHMIHIGECQFFIATDEGEFVGYCLATKRIYPIEIPKVCGCINGIFISDSHRRKGIGTTLYNAAIDWFKSDNINYIELYHQINDERAGAFWKSLGFVPIQYNCALVLDD